MKKETLDIPQLNQLLYTVKLSTGEDLLCTLVDEVDNGIVIEEPIQYKFIPILTEEGFINRLVTNKWQVFSSESIFFIPNKDLLTYNPMNKHIYSFYVDSVNKFNNEVPEMEDKPFIMEPSSIIQ